MRSPADGRRWWVVVVLAFPLFGCPYGAEVPLDTAAAPLDARLLGRWRCVSGETEDVGTIEFQAAKGSPDHYDVQFLPCDESDCAFRAHLTLVAGAPILNAQELKKDADKPGDWSFARYTLLRPDVLHFELAREEPFNGVPKTQAPAIRHVFEEHMGKPDLFDEWVTCVRVKAKDGAAAPGTSR